MLPVHQRAELRGFLQSLHGRQNGLSDVPGTCTDLRLAAGPRPSQHRVIPEMAHPVHAGIVHIPHMALPVHAHPEHPALRLIGMGCAVRQDRLGTDLPGYGQDRSEALGHGEQHLRMVPGQELHRGAVRAKGGVHDALLPRQVEGAGVVLRQVAVGARRLGRGWRGFVLGGDRGGAPQPPQAQQQRQQPSGPKALTGSPAWQGLKATRGFAHG